MIKEITINRYEFEEISALDKRIEEYNQKVDYYKMLSELSPEVEEDLCVQYRVLTMDILLSNESKLYNIIVPEYKAAMIKSIDCTFAGPALKK